MLQAASTHELIVKTVLHTSDKATTAAPATALTATEAASATCHTDIRHACVAEQTPARGRSSPTVLGMQPHCTFTPGALLQHAVTTTSDSQLHSFWENSRYSRRMPCLPKQAKTPQKIPRTGTQPPALDPCQVDTASTWLPRTGPSLPSPGPNVQHKPSPPGLRHKTLQPACHQAWHKTPVITRPQRS